MEGAAKRLGLPSELCAVSLAQQMQALHLASAGLLDNPHDLSPTLVPAVALGMVLQPAIDELGGPLGKPVLLNEPGGRLLVGSLQSSLV